MAVTAATIINAVRDQIPDPIFDGSGNPLPSTDGGLFRTSTLCRFINDATKALCQKVGWYLEDWTAFGVTANQPFYALDAKWIDLDLQYSNALRLSLAPEGSTIWPRPVVGAQAVSLSIHKTTDHLDITVFPMPIGSDPATTLTNNPGISSSATSVSVTSSSGFLPFGYVQIENEICYYGALSGNALSPLVRGQCGTQAAAHSQNVSVSHLSIWIKGNRNPAEVAVSSDIIEVHNSFVWLIQDFVIARCNTAQNDIQGWKAYMDYFNTECKAIRGDPGWRSDAQGCQVIPYGLPLAGRLAWGPFGVIVP